MSYDFHTSSEHTARKAFRCEEARCEVRPGDCYVKVAGNAEGDFYSCKFCLRCMIMRREAWDAFDWDPDCAAPYGELRSYLIAEEGVADPEAWLDERLATRRDAAAAKAAAAEAAVDAFLSEVRAELIRARAKFPGDRIMTIALAEEFGELCKAVLDEPAENVRKEAVQTAVMAARVVLDGDGSVNEWRAAKGLDPLVTRDA